jgi:hypothetical protein
MDFLSDLSESRWKIRPNQRAEIAEQAKKIAAWKAAANSGLGLILRGKEYHRWHNFVNKYLRYLLMGAGIGTPPELSAHLTSKEQFLLVPTLAIGSKVFSLLASRYSPH